MADVSAQLLQEWKNAAKQGKPVNVTRDVSFMVLKSPSSRFLGKTTRPPRPISSSLRKAELET
jgi:hypothetical protein